MSSKKTLNKIRLRRQKRTRAKVRGTGISPRLSVFRSNRFSYAQIIDDAKGQTIISASTRELKSKVKITKKEQAKQLGELIAKKAIEKGIKKVVLDRGHYKYHGRIKEIAEGARKGGLQL